MSEHRFNPPSRVTLEDLLRLKRAERPPPEFWSEFERELRQKQLAALVERRSWWHDLAAVGSRFGRMRLPLGAAAVLALFFLSIRYQFQSGGAAQLMVAGRPAIQAVALTAAKPHDNTKLLATASPAREPAPAPEARASSSSVLGTALAAGAPQATPGRVSEVIPWLGDVLDGRAGASELTPSARTIAVNLATVAVIEPELVDALARPRGFEERAMPEVRPRHTAEVLPTAAAVTEPRRARLLASLSSAGAYAPEASAPEHVTRSVNRSLSEDGWDRSIGRLEAEGDHLSIKF
jgi:hypothetical protein